MTIDLMPEPDDLGITTEPYKKRSILRNRAQCAKCGDVIESFHRHDLVNCKCGRIYVDGGRFYLRRGYTEPDDIIELSEYKD